MPVAANCRLVPAASEVALGVTAIETSVAAVEFSRVDAETVPRKAAIVVVPTARAVARPFMPYALLTVAVAVVEELQTTELVRSRVVLSVYVPVAVNCWLVPSAMPGFGGVTWMDTNVAAVTRSISDAETPPSDAERRVEPRLWPSTRPREPAALLTVAMAGIDEVHRTDAVRS